MLNERVRRPSSSSVPPSGSRAATSASPAIRSVRSVNARTGRSARPEMNQPSAAPVTTPPAVTSSSTTRSRSSSESVSSSPRASCAATPGATCVVSTRRCAPCTVWSERNAAREPAATSRARASTCSATPPTGGCDVVPSAPTSCA